MKLNKQQKQDPKERVEPEIDTESMKQIELLLQQGKYHGICIINWTDYIDIFVQKLGPILYKFCIKGNGSILFPTSQTKIIPYISKIFDDNNKNSCSSSANKSNIIQ